MSVMQSQRDILYQYAAAHNYINHLTSNKLK